MSFLTWSNIVSKRESEGLSDLREVKAPGLKYLYSLGVPSFLLESEILDLAPLMNFSTFTVRDCNLLNASTKKAVNFLNASAIALAILMKKSLAFSPKPFPSFLSDWASCLGVGICGGVCGVWVAGNCCY